MTNSRWDRIKEVFNAALAVAPADRPELLRRLAGDDAELRREVESLLDARTVSIVRTGGAAHALADLSTSSIPDPHAADRVGMLILRYKLLQLIGEGGFGTVYLAEQTEPVRRKVALKVIKPGMDSRAIVARFEAERQALAMMDHPHIARVLDGGVTPLTDSGGGLPFFVMEYVVGDPITRFADAHALSITDRLELFQQVCSAVQHAHTKGIIHRDLKPANVLVSMVDGKPFVKVIDFGIAKATGASGGRLTDKTFFTEHRQLIGTPEYMSPEQAEGSLDIDTRTDVYALGVLLYELLTGTTPIEAARLRSAAYDEMRRMIREDEPLAPSLKLSRSLETLARTAAARKVEPGRLSGIVKGELDWIVMRALEKERGRRYETPSALADDVRRHLSGEPVVAAPVSRAYRVRKFVRKNKGPVAAVSAVMLALAAGGSVAAWQANAAQRAAMREREAAVAAQVQQRNAEAARDALAKQIKSIRDVFDSVSAEVRQAAQVGVFPAAEPKVVRPPAGTDPTLAQLQTMREYSTQWIRQAVASHRALQEQAALAIANAAEAERQASLVLDAAAFAECAVYGFQLDFGDDVLTFHKPPTEAALRHLPRVAGILERTEFRVTGSVTVEAIKALAAADTGLKNLTTLSLYGTNVTDDGLKALAAADTGLKNLTTLNLYNINVTADGLKVLAAADSGLKNLTTLNLITTSVTDDGLKALAAADTGLKNLTTLNLMTTSVTDDGLKALAAADTGLKNLTTLDLSYTSVTDDGLKALAAADTGLKSLTTLDVTWSKVTAEGIAAVKARFPGINVVGP
jgi:serine/threonine protein kinase